MFVNFFENAFTSDYKRLEIDDNSPLFELSEKYKIDLKNSLCFVNGFQKNPDYILKENDICTIRAFPSAVAATAVLLVGNAVAFAVLGAKIAEFVTGKKTIGEQSVKDWSSSESSSTSTSQTLPSIKGSSNSSALGHAIPLVLGKTSVTPYFINNPYTTIEDGENESEKYGGVQKFHCLYLIGYNDLKIEDVSLGSHLISSNSENTENGILVNDGTYFSDDYQAKIEIQQGENEVSLVPQKVVQTDYSVELSYVDDTSLKAYAFSAKYPQKIELEIELPNGLYDTNSSGSQIKCTAQIAVQMSIDGGENWIAVPEGFTHCSYSVSDSAKLNTITAKHFYTMRLILTLDFTDSKITEWKNAGYSAFDNFSSAYDFVNSITDNVIQFKIWNIKQDSTGDSAVNKVSLSSIRTWCYDNKLSNETDGIIAQVPMISKYRNRTCRLGFEIKADSLTTGTLSALNLIATSKARVWDGDGWSATTQTTNNPAALALLILTKSCRGDYAYELDETGDYPASDKIDLESFGEVYEICDEDITWTSKTGKSYTVKKYECNSLITNQKQTLELVNSVLECARSFIVIRGKKYGICIDEKKDYSVLVLSSQNVLSRTNSKEFDDIPDGFSVEFINALEDYQTDTITAVPSGLDENDSELKLEKISYPLITNAYHARKEALYKLRCRNLRCETWSATLGVDGYLVEIGDKVEIQDDTILVGIGDGAEIKKVIFNEDNTAVKGIKTDGEFHITDFTKDYAVKYTKIVERNGEYVSRVFYQKVAITENEDGYYDSFYFADEISLDDESIPEEEDIIAFGVYSKETYEALCFGKTDNGDGTFELTLVPYDERIYEDDLSDFEYDSKITKPSQETSRGITLSSFNEQLKNQSELVSSLDKTSFALSPASQNIACDSTGEILDKTTALKITAYFYDNGTQITENVTYSAFIGENEIGEWSENVLSISPSLITEDSINITVKATYENKTKTENCSITKSYAGKSGGYQDYQFAVGDFDLTTEELLTLTWYESPPTVGDGQCLYAATKWIEGE